MNTSTNEQRDGRPAASSLSLSLPVEEIARELAPPASSEPVEDPELAAMAESFVRDVLELQQAGSAENQRAAIDGMGVEVQRLAAHRSAMLQTRPPG
jgi:hypothetical protein